MITRNEILAREARLALPVAIAAVVAVVLIYAVPTLIINQIVSGETDAEFLRAIEADSSAFMAALSGRSLGYLLLALPLAYLFGAVVARSETVRGQLIGVVYAAPVFLALSTVLVAFASLDAASEFVARDLPAAGEQTDEAANELISQGTLRSIAGGFGIAGQLGFAIAVAYTAFQAMKIGLLTRFWGSLGAALGVASFLFPLFALLWFVYLALLIAGWVPGGRPPAWAEGRAIPWPTPDSARLEVEEDEPGEDEPGLDLPHGGRGQGRPGGPADAEDAPEWDDEALGSPERRDRAEGEDSASGVSGEDEQDGASEGPAPSRASPPRKRKRRE